jgi:hypothetical protein
MTLTNLTSDTTFGIAEYRRNRRLGVLGVFGALAVPSDRGAERVNHAPLSLKMIRPRFPPFRTVINYFMQFSCLFSSRSAILRPRLRNVGRPPVMGIGHREGGA